MQIVEITAEQAEARIEAILGLLNRPEVLFRRIAGTLEAETMHNFDQQGRPSWVPLAESTKAERLKRNRGSSVLKILQDRGILRASVDSGFDADSSFVSAGGAASAYAGPQQFGATIERPAHSTKVRLRTDRKGNLQRQGTKGSASGRAVFAKDSHKQVRESWHEVGAFTIEIPARPYLPFRGGPTDGTLQPETETAVLDVVTRMLGGASG